LKAIVARRYGPPEVLRLEDLDTPRPAADEVSIRVRAAGVNALDWRLMRGEPFPVRFFYGLRRPKFPVPGRDVAGIVEAVGADVTRFRAGDAVFGLCHGAFAEVAVAKAAMLAPKPAGLSFERAAVGGIAGITALQGLRDVAHLQPGQAVLVNGAMGGVGQFAVQIAKAFGATVTGVCSTHNVEAVRGMGADHVVDYTRDDFTSGGARYDLVFDTIGNHAAADVVRVLAPTGRYVIAGVAGGLAPYVRRSLQAWRQDRRGPQRCGSYVCREDGKDIEVMRELLASGAVTPVIDRRYSLAETAEAVRYVEAGHARGKVVVAMEGHAAA
jgi:NADPH:quinone reductase-like Zn-dependent oxidoreductase